jgi:hypothetical protein
MNRWTRPLALALVAAGAFALAAACSSSSPPMWDGPPDLPAFAAAASSGNGAEDGGSGRDATSSHTADAARASSMEPTSTAGGEAGAAQDREASAAISEGGASDGPSDGQSVDGAPSDGGAVCSVDNLKYLGELVAAGPEPEPCTSGCPASYCCYLGVACLPE